MENSKTIKTQAIVPAAGPGTRLGSDEPKPLVMLKGKPLIVYALCVLADSPLIHSIVLVVEGSLLNEFRDIIERYRIPKISKIVPGGEVRRESVSNGIDALDDDTEIVLIHDGARPFLTQGIIERTIKDCCDHMAVIAAVPVKPTIKRVNAGQLYVEGTLDRNILWEAQTPQVFKRDVIARAHGQSDGIDATDDAFLTERLGIQVKVALGEYSNIKITTKEDLDLAGHILEKSSHDKRAA